MLLFPNFALLFMVFPVLVSVLVCAIFCLFAVAAEVDCLAVADLADLAAELKHFFDLIFL